MDDVPVVSAVTHGNHDDADYDAYLARVNARFLANIGDSPAPLFTTDADGLWGAYLDSFDGPARQYHNCHACRQFIERFGALVTINEQGRTESAIWSEDDAPEAYKPAVAAISRLVRRAKVTGPFLSSDDTWGTPVTGIWRHFYVSPPSRLIYRRTTLTAGQAMAEKREDFKTVMHALNEFTQPMIEQALTLLRTDSLYRSEKVLGQAEWLHSLHVARAAAQGSNRANVVWRAVAAAPAGFCHPRTSMIGTLLEDIAAGMDFGDVSRRFAAKMHPLAYQRPQAAPSAGAIAAAEKVMQELGAAGALARRFARLDEIRALWKPTVTPPPATSGVFGHLLPKGARIEPMAGVPPVTMTWEKFQREVLPGAQRIEWYAPASRQSFCGLVTAANPDAPPILQWDREDARNPVSWYFWNGGSTPAQYGLAANAWHDVEAVALKPSMWNGGQEHQGKGVLFVISGARETRMSGAALFPEIMRSEFHGVRSVIEAYSRSAEIAGMNDPHAAGIMLSSGAPWDIRLRVTSAGRPVEYRLDRWD